MGRTVQFLSGVQPSLGHGEAFAYVECSTIILFLREIGLEFV